MKKSILLLILLSMLNFTTANLEATLGDWWGGSSQPEKTTPSQPQENPAPSTLDPQKKETPNKKLAKLLCNVVQSTQLVVIITKEATTEINRNIHGTLQVENNWFETGIEELDKLNSSCHVVKTVWENAADGKGRLTVYIEGLDMERAKQVAEAYLSLEGCVEDVALVHQRKIDCTSSIKKQTRR